MTLERDAQAIATLPADENPYVGPRTFTRKEANRFFGRDREARELLSLVIAERFVLFYAQSGAGKSSLLNTRLIPQLRESGFLVLPVGRVGGELPTGIADVDNIYVFNLLLSLDQGRDDRESDPRRFAQMPLVDFMGGLRTPDGEYYYYDDALIQTADPAADDPGQPPHVLIIDQFEELITTHPARWRQRQDFFHQLDAAMRADPLLWVVLTLREDFVPALDPYARLVAGGMRARFYMQRMGVDAALQAICRPAEDGGRPFAEGVAEKLTDNLRQIRVQGQAEPQPGQYVEPVQLQVVCYQLWENLKKRSPAPITEADLKEAGDVDTALADFYESALATVLAHPDIAISERQIRNWFDTQLVTEAGTRGTVYQGENQTAGMPNRVVRLLQAQFLLRVELRAGGSWVELIHDRFVGPIQQANRRQQTPLAQDAEAWLAAGKTPNHLYTSYRLENAQKQMASDPQSFSPLEREFVEAAIRAEDQRKRRRLQLITISGTLLILVLVGLTSWSLWNQQRTVNALETARSDATAVARAQLELEAQRANAVTARGIAEAEATAAEVARQEAFDLANSLMVVLTAQAPTPTPPPATPTLASSIPSNAATFTPSPTPTPDLRATQTLEAVQAQLARVQATQAAVPSPTTASVGGAIVTIPISVQDMSSEEIAVAELWNRMGAVILEIAERYDIDAATVVGTIMAESSGRGFGSDGRLIIRFETHMFFDYWGKDNPGIFNRYFQFNPNERWRDHQWRSSLDAAWQPVHIDQQMEWQAFDFARALNETAALQSISMGSPQLMGFNATPMGYASVQEMFDSFQQGEAEQIEGLFRLIEARGLTDPLRRGDLLAFTTGYNGSGQAEFYQTLIKRYAGAFADLYVRWIEPEIALRIATIAPTLLPTATATATSIPTATAVPTATLVPVAWPPTGEIVFASNQTNRIGDLFAIRPGSGGIRRLTENMGFEPSYSPANGGRIAFAAQPDQRVSIYTMAPDGSQMRNLTGFDTDNWEPALSPDGRHIAFVSSRNNLDWEIYTMRVDGTEVTPLTNSDPARNTMPAWSPDGNRIVFVRFENAETSHIYTMNRDGTNQRQLTTVAARNEYPDWSPDGGKIVFASNRTGNMDLFVMNVDGSNLRNLTRSSEDENFPSWSLDGQWIAFTRFVGNTDIFVMTADGQSVTNVTQSPEDEWAPVWLP